MSQIEILEARIAPASMLTFSDLQGDQVKITSSKGTLTTGLLTLSQGPTGQLQELNLSGGGFEGAAIQIAVLKKGAGSPGLADVGYINATGVNLASVSVTGDLGRIDAGTNSASIMAIGKLSVHSMGAQGLATQAGGNLSSNINGQVGTFKVSGDVDEARISVTGTNGGIKMLNIGGSVVGGTGPSSGQIIAGDMSNADPIDQVVIGKNIVGGTGPQSGVVLAYGSIKSATIGGSVIGGSGSQTGIFEAVGDLGSLVISGSIIGGSATSAVVSGIKSIGTVTVKGSLIGGSNNGTGMVDQAGEIASTGHIHKVTINGSVIAGANTGGGTLSSSGSISSDQSSIDSITIGGSVIGNATDPVFFSAYGQTIKPTVGNDVAIGSVTINGDANYLNILAGFHETTDANADASIGKIAVKGNWRASNAVAGAHQKTAPDWGVGDSLQTIGDTSRIADIASIVIGGDLQDTADAQQFGFVAQRIEALKIGTRKIVLNPGNGNDNFTVDLGAQVHVEEVA